MLELAKLVSLTKSKDKSNVTKPSNTTTKLTTLKDKTMNLISMTDFVLEQISINQFDEDFTSKVVNYANFLKQPLKLGFFIPCDENDMPLYEPENYDLWCKYGDFTQFGTSLTLKCRPYQKAKERVLFEGFELVNDELLNNGVLFWVGDFDGKETVENIIPCNVKLTDSAIKQLNL